MKIPNKRNHKYHYSPLRYPGGKTFLFPFFDKLIKNKFQSATTYIEPYAGGAGAALALLYLEKVDSVIINDLDKAIYSFWKSAICDTRQFIKKIYSTPITIREWKNQRLIYQNRRSKRFDLGFAVFFLNRTNVSGIIDGGVIGGIDQKGKWKIDARFNKDNLAKRIEQLSEYRNRIEISQKDGIQLIKDYLDKKDVLIYLDPPYYEKGSCLYLNHYRHTDHELLASLLNEHSDSNWVLTYDNNRIIRELYANRKLRNYSLFYNTYKSRKGKEVLILSDTLAN
ncbi:MAG: DNA adenine methylase [candidate division Zixibacteria bacterium]